MSIASLESAYGTQMFRPNNMFGYGRTGFSSKQEGIMTVAKGLGTRYLPPGGSLYGGSPTLKGVNKRYAANPQWYYKVGKYMQGYYAELAAEKNGALDKFE
jgi:beta-N-acetylglucosaminidase